MDHVDERCHTARKTHRCNLCGRRIEKGERYKAQVNADAGRIWSFKMHLNCLCIAHQHYTTSEDWEMHDADEFRELILNQDELS